MADPNNVPQEAQQLSEDLNSQDDDTRNKAGADMAKTNFDAEYEEAQANSGGSGNQSSDSNPVSRANASSGSNADQAGLSKESGKIDNIDSPGDSDPDDYADMAREVTKGKAEA